ncbi:hypothetical protein V8F20_009021 [Naviculisporaceae sp. PSN 640]
MAPPAEISIPTTSLSQPDASSSSSKPFTLYNITLRLPLRSFVVQKRYSDFVALHAQLTSLVGAPPPAPLPGKSWFKSTVSSPELTEKRRVGLEAYLRAIAEPPDRRWRDTSAWRAFLNLPGGGGGASASQASASGVSLDYRSAAARLPAIGLKETNLVAASDPGTWLDLHREMKGALHEARVALGRRDNATENGVKIEAGAAAKRALVKAGSLLVALGDGLKLLKEGGKVGEGELRRRRDLLAAARVERDGLDRVSSSLGGLQDGGNGAAGGGGGQIGRVGTGFSTTSSTASGSGSASGSRFGGGRVLGAPLPETDKTRELDNDGVLQLQRNILKEQESDVEALARIVQRQKEMGLAIDDEVRRHIDLLDRMDQDVDVLGKKMAVANTREQIEGDDEEEEEEIQHDGASSSAESVPGSDSESVDEAGEEKQQELDSSTERLSTKEEVTGTDLAHEEERRRMGGGRIVTRGRGVGDAVVRDNDAGAGGITDAILLLIVRCVLTGMHGVVVLQWVLGKVSEGLAWVVDLGMLLVGQPPQPLPQTATTSSGRGGPLRNDNGRPRPG